MLMTSLRALALTACLLVAGCVNPSSGGQLQSESSASSAPIAPVRLAAATPYQGPLPDFADKKPDVADNYRWAAPNRHILQYFQCTCGCDQREGHKSNWNCYVKEEKPGGEYVWDPMSAG